jgi:CHAD domain-containing protein
VQTAQAQPHEPARICRTVRRRRILLDASGTSLAEVVTDAVSAQTLGATTTVSQWHEVEIELTGGGAALLRAADKRLRRSRLTPAGHSAKLERALASQLPEPDRRRQLTPRSPAADLVLDYGQSQLARLQALDPMVRRDEPDSVHQMRVATRRLRSTLKSFDRVLGQPAASEVRAELKWLGGVLGEARDNEVLVADLQSRLGRVPAELLLGPVSARVRAYFAPRAAAARGALIDALDSERYIYLLNDLDQLLSGPGSAAEALLPAGDVLPAAVGKACSRVRRRARRAGRAPAGRARERALHETRKAAKDARYAAEAARPAGGSKARRLARRMKVLQASLGDHHDAVVARDALRDIGVLAHLAGENAFSFGLLHESCQQAALACEGRARDDWKRALRPQYGGWLR